MSTPFTGKTALITGGSKGIGAATSLLLAKSGANVVINYASDASAADKLVKTIGNEHAFAIRGDAGIIPDIERMVSETVKRFGKVDILVPCAGMLLMKDLEHTTEQDFDNLMRLNVKGPYFLAQVSHISFRFPQKNSYSKAGKAGFPNRASCGQSKDPSVTSHTSKHYFQELNYSHC